MADDPVYDEINDAKTNLNHIYNEPDPRAYFRQLKGVNYSIPGAAKPIFLKLIGALQERANDAVRVLDLGCSYGVNAALLKHDLSIGDLYDHWGQKELVNAAPENIVQRDKRFFANLDEAEDIEVIGLDVAENAIAFAEETGLLDEGFSVNLETEALPEAAKKELAPIDLLTSTGCVGYVTERSFNRLMPTITEGRQPWLANFVLRMFPFDAIEDTLNDHGYVTEKLQDRTFVQRKFMSADEQAQVLDQLQDLGIDPSGKESEGNLLAEFYLSRPSLDAADIPIDELVAA